LKSATSAVLLALALAWMQPRRSGLDLTNFDRTVRPQDDLFRAVNGRWLSRTAVPPDRVTYGTCLELADKTRRRPADDYRACAFDREPSVAVRDRLPTLYTSLTDQSRTDELGLRPVAALLQRIEAIRRRALWRPRRATFRRLPAGHRPHRLCRPQPAVALQGLGGVRQHHACRDVNRDLEGVAAVSRADGRRTLPERTRDRVAGVHNVAGRKASADLRRLHR
jgi:hypothetical protein